MLVTIDNFWSWMKQTNTKQKWNKNFFNRKSFVCDCLISMKSLTKLSNNFAHLNLIKLIKMIYPFCSQGTMVLLSGSLRLKLLPDDSFKKVTDTVYVSTFQMKQAPSLAAKHLRCWSRWKIFGHESNKAIWNKIEIKISSREKFCL